MYFQLNFVFVFYLVFCCSKSDASFRGEGSQKSTDAIMIMMIDDIDDDCDGDNRTYGFNQYLLVIRDHRSI